MKRETQGDTAYQELRRRILIGQLEPSARLKEDEWAKKLNVSRMAIRESLTRLLGEGLVESGERGGYFVAEMSIEDIKNLRELREIMELAAIRLLIDRISEIQIKELYNICADFSEMVQKGYVMGACEADIKFHETLVRFSGNPRLLRAYKNSHIPLFHQKLGKTKAYLDDYDLTHQEHLSIVDAVKRKNIAEAEKILIKHFKRGEQAVIDK